MTAVHALAAAQAAGDGAGSHMASLGVALLALMSGAVLSALQHAVLGAGRVPLEMLAERMGRPAATARVRSILSDLTGHATSLAFPRIVSHLLCATAAVVWLREIRGSESAGVTELAIAVLVASTLVWLLSSVLPMSVAEHAAEQTVYHGSRLIRATHLAMSPVRPVFGFVNEVVRRLTGSERRTAADELEEELRHVVEESQREGQLDEVERGMIEAVVELRDTSVEQIMTPRTEVKAIEYTEDFDRVRREVDRIGHSRIPVYEESLDHIVGVLYAKDLLKRMVSELPEPGSRLDLRSILRSATYVPETKTVRELLGELLAAQVHIAIVADEYGGTSGLVTIEDIVEEIFGEIRDEYESGETDEPSVDLDPVNRLARLDARTEIDSANDELESLGIEIPESEDYDTVGGFVVVTLGRIPEVGESFRHDGFEVTVLDAEPTRVKRVELRPAEGASPATPEERAAAGA